MKVKIKQCVLVFIVQIGIILGAVPSLFSLLYNPNEGPLGPMPGFCWDEERKTYIGKTKEAAPIKVPIIQEWLETIGLTQSPHAFPFSIQVIDAEKKIFQVTLGNPRGSNVSIKVGPEGIYDPSGRLQGPSVTVELNGQRFAIQVKQFTADSEEEIKIAITPQSGGFPLSGSYRQEFALGRFRGEVRLGGEGTRPTLYIGIRNPEHGQAALTAGPEGDVSMDVRGVIQLGEAEGPLGKGTADVRTFRISSDGVHINGNLKWQITRGGYTLALKLGDYLRITPAGEKIEKEGVLDKLLTNREIGKRLDNMFPGMTEEQIRQALGNMLNDAIKEFKNFTLAGGGRDKVKVPDSLRFFLSLAQDQSSVSKIAELVLPLIVGSLALELSAYPEMKEAKLVFSLTEAQDESGRPKIIWGIGIQERNGEIRGIFTAADSTGLNSAEIVTSFTRGLESVLLRHARLEARFTQAGFEVGTIERGVSELSGLGWRASYTQTGGWGLELSYKVPYVRVVDGKDEVSTLKTFVLLGLQGLMDFGIKLPVLGGILELTPRQATYLATGKGYSVSGTFGGGAFRVGFQFDIVRPWN